MLPQVTLDIAAFLSQVSAMVLWPVLIGMSDPRFSGMSKELIWAIPLSLGLISVGWWENYIDDDTHLGGVTDALQEMKKSKLLRKHEKYEKECRTRTK